MRGSVAAGPRGSRRAGALLLAFAAAVAVAACVSSPEQPAGDERDGRKVAADTDEETLGHLGRANRAAEAGDLTAALAALNVALRRAGDHHRDRIQEMRLAFKRRAMAEMVEARVRAVDDRLIAGRPIRLLLELVNRSTQAIVVPRIDYRRRLVFFRKEVGRSRFDLRFELLDLDAAGTGRREQFNRLLEPEDDIVVEPGGTWSRRITVDSDQLSPETEFSARLSGRLLRRLTLEVVLRPVQLLFGGRDFFTTIRFEPAVVYLLPRGSEPIREDPLRHLELALLRSPLEPRFTPNILVAACLLEGEKRENGRAMLARCRDEGAPVLRPVALQALALFWPPEANAAPEPDAEAVFKPLER